MKTLIYRKATMQDLPEIMQLKNKVKAHNAAIQLDIWQGDYPQQDLVAEDIQHQCARILETEAGQIIGFTCFQPTEHEYPNATYPANRMSFSRLMVDCDMQGQGIGTYFIEHLIQETKSNQKDGMIITVDYFNNSAIHLYKKFGFEKTGTIRIPQAKYRLDVYSLSFE